MELYIVRHGAAQERGEGPDAQRALTPKGAVRMAQVARGLRTLRCRPARILTSPLPRAEQTARILAGALCPEAPVELCDWLAPGAAAEELVAHLADAAEQSVMVVGHSPDVGAIASELLCGRAGPEIVLKKGAVCCMSFGWAPALGAGRLEWLLQPSHLRALARKG